MGNGRKALANAAYLAVFCVIVGAYLGGLIFAARNDPEAELVEVICGCSDGSRCIAFRGAPPPDVLERDRAGGAAATVKDDYGNMVGLSCESGRILLQKSNKEPMRL